MARVSARLVLSLFVLLPAALAWGQSACFGLFEKASFANSVLIAKDRTEWSKIKSNGTVHVMAMLRGQELDQLVQELVAQGKTDKEIYDGLGRAMTEDLFHPFIERAKAAYKTQKSGQMEWYFRFFYNLSGSRLMVALIGKKAVVENVFQGLDLESAWLLDRGENPLAGNTLEIRNENVFVSAGSGLRTMDLRRGVGRGVQVGPGAMTDGQKAFRIEIERVVELPFNQVTPADLNQQEPGLTQASMLTAMQNYYPGFTATDMVTMIFFRRR